MILETIAIVLPPVAAWVGWVEMRLAKLQSTSDAVERIDARVERLYDHILGSRQD